MFGCLVVLFFTMAGNAVQAGLYELFLAMTAMAVHCIVGVILLVPGQAEAGHELVVDVLDGEFGDGGLASLVFDMA